MENSLEHKYDLLKTKCICCIHLRFLYLLSFFLCFCHGFPSAPYCSFLLLSNSTNTNEETQVHLKKKPETLKVLPVLSTADALCYMLYVLWPARLWWAAVISNSPWEGKFISYHLWNMHLFAQICCGCEPELYKRKTDKKWKMVEWSQGINALFKHWGYPKKKGVQKKCIKKCKLADSCRWPF